MFEVGGEGERAARGVDALCPSRLRTSRRRRDRVGGV